MMVDLDELRRMLKENEGNIGPYNRAELFILKAVPLLIIEVEAGRALAKEVYDYTQYGTEDSSIMYAVEDYDEAVALADVFPKKATP